MFRMSGAGVQSFLDQVRFMSHAILGMLFLWMVSRGRIPKEVNFTFIIF